jgi:predicted Zn-dependent protease
MLIGSKNHEAGGGKEFFVMQRIATALLTLAMVLAPGLSSAFTLFSDKQMTKMGAESYEEMKKKTPISKDPALNQRVACVAGPLTDLAGGRSKWEFTVFDVDEANAFALPGGKIGVYKGLFKVATNPSQLAAVLGHEIGHVKAEHGNERVSTDVVTQLGLSAVEAFIGGGSSGNSKYIMAGLGLGSQVGIMLPFGRAQESEADRIGLKLMARAGFDPNEAVQLWRNMKKSTGKGPPQFLSTHPSPNTRIDELRRQVPKVMPLYEAAPRKPKC